MYHLERACEMQIAALAGGSPVVVPGEAVQAVARAQGADQSQRVADEYIWPAMLRRLDRIGSNYDQ